MPAVAGPLFRDAVTMYGIAVNYRITKNWNRITTEPIRAASGDDTLQYIDFKRQREYELL